MSDFAVDPEQVKELAAAMERDAAAARGAEPPPAAPQPPEQQGAESATSDASEGPEDDLGPPPSFDDVLAQLPEEHRAAAKAAYDARVAEYQGTFTRKTQEYAAMRKELEGLGDPDELAEAKEFYDSVRYDADFAREIHAQLSEALDISTAEAQQLTAAADAVDPLTETDPALAALRDEVQAMRDDLAQEREQAQYEAAHAALSQRLAAQEAEVRVAHPEWDDDMIERVYAHGAGAGIDIDLVQAANELAALEQAAIARYINEKTANPVPAVTGGAGEGHVPVEPAESLDAAQAKAREIWAAYQADRAG